MIRTEAEHKEAKKKLAHQQAQIQEHREMLEKKGTSEEEIQQSLESLIAYRDQLRRDIKMYERWKDGDLSDIQSLEDLNQWLVGARIAKGWSLSELAEELEVSVQQVSRDEKNQYQGVQVGRAQRILDALGIEFTAEVTEPKPTKEKETATSRLSLIDATGLQQWADRRDAQGDLPELIRRLVWATNRSITRLRFDSKKGVQAGGWDGVVEARDATDFVPAGASYWELGTGKNVRKKANKDYRTHEDVLEARPSEDTFVFVTPRRWPEKDKWERSKNEEGKWKEVRAYDADDLVSWLEHAPAVYTWIAELIEYAVDDFESLTSWWDRWTGVTDPPLSVDLILGGRSDTAEDIQSWIRDEPSSYLLTADSREEALAFFAATVHQLQDEEREQLASTSLVVESSKAWRKVIGSRNSLLLVPLFESSGEIAEAIRHGHRVFVPGDRTLMSDSQGNELSRLRVDKTKKALEELGEPEERAKDLAVTARRSLLSLRRVLSTDPALEKPTWTRPDRVRYVLPALLAGRWSAAKEGDREALSQLSDMNYEEYVTEAGKLARQSDPPVRTVGSTWFIASKWDGWRLIARALTPDDVERFEEVVLNVLGMSDPALDVPPEKRLIAEMQGDRMPYSKHLRKGLADTLALVAASEPEKTAQRLLDAQTVKRIVRKLFHRAEENEKLWASLSDVLPLLAEAAPAVFLRAVDQGISGKEPLLQHLFTDSESSQTPLGNSSPHTGLLWALETLAWSKEHFGYAVRLLASLVRIDPGGNLANRPENSLRKIFVLWHPQTVASLQERLEAIDTLRRHEPEVAWQLMENILPKSHDTLTPGRKPDRRQWGWNARSGVPYSEMAEGIQEIAERLLEDAGEDGSRWANIISNFGSMPANHQEAILEELTELAASLEDAEVEREIFEALREVVSHHRAHPDADGALPSDRVDELEEVSKQFDRVPLAWQYKHLFDHGSLTQFDGDNHTEQQQAWKEEQDKVVAKILEADGVETLLELANEIDLPRFLGRSLGRVGLPDEQENLFLQEHLSLSNTPFVQLAQGCIEGIREREGWRTLTNSLQSGIEAGWSSETVSAFLLACPRDQRTWETVNELGDEVQDLFWQNISAGGISDKDDREYVAEHLLEHNRPHAVVDMLGLYSRKEPASPALIRRALEQAARSSPSSDTLPQSFSHRVGELLNTLEDSDEVEREAVANLEWVYLPLLYRPAGDTRSARILHQELADDPGFFSDVVSLVYQPEDREEDIDLDEDDQMKARLAYQLLDSWTTVPGSQDDGSIDETILSKWVDQARTRLSENARLAVGEQEIGKVLRHGPDADEDRWPAEPICNLIERVASDDLERGFRVEVHNSRGAHAVSVAQERSLAERYNRFAKEANTRWPRTAAMLRDIAEDFERNARRYEKDEELRQDLHR